MKNRMLLICWILLTALISTSLFISASYAATIYVDTDASGSNNGTSWADAYLDLQSALSQAGSSDMIWVAEGTYTPSVEVGGTGDRYRSFQLKNAVALYGGFDPTVGDITLDNRDWENNITILSGDIGVQGNSSDNCYHVFNHYVGVALNSTATIDGFTITGGRADYVYGATDGGGMELWYSSPTIRNCTFSGNRAYLNGGAIHAANSHPTITDCIFTNNFADSGAAIYFSSSSSSQYTYVGGCTFSGNAANSNGGAMSIFEAYPNVTNCKFINNSAGLHGGAIINWDDSYSTFINCIFYGNTADEEGGGIHSYSSDLTTTNCTFAENSSPYGGALYNYFSSPRITNCILWGDTPNEIFNAYSAWPIIDYSNVQGGYSGTGNINQDPLFVNLAIGDLHLTLGSPSINTGDPSTDYPETDLDGKPRILGGIVDMGAYESGTPEICDGVDNDLDGLVDEDLTRITTCGVGACAGNTGYETCSDGDWVGDTCDPYEGASAEICDGMDNDCNGLVDDAVPNCGSSCAGSAGASTLGASPVHASSDLVEHLGYFMLPLATVIGLIIWRRKR